MSWSITGSAMITSVGDSKEACFDAFVNGVSGNKPLQFFDKQRFNCERAYERARTEGADPKEQKARASKLVAGAVRDALRDAGIGPNDGRVVVLIGTGLRELRTLELWWADGVPMHVDELHFGEAVRKQVGAQIPVMTFSNACAASNFALGIGLDLLELDEADIVVAAGVDTITESMFGLLDRVNPTHPNAVQPFDANRKGVLMGDGAAAVVIEKTDHAKARGAKTQALVRSVALNCDAFHETAPAVPGIKSAIEDAHARALVRPEQIDLVLVHGTGTALNDAGEAQALSEVFGANANKPLISGLKSMTGHTSGASGLVGVVTAVECLRTGKIPPTVGFETPMEEAKAFNIVHGKAAERDMTIAQVNAFGFGGVNAVVILEGTR